MGASSSGQALPGAPRPGPRRSRSLDPGCVARLLEVAVEERVRRPRVDGPARLARPRQRLARRRVDGDVLVRHDRDRDVDVADLEALAVEDPGEDPELRPAGLEAVEAVRDRLVAVLVREPPGELA